MCEWIKAVVVLQVWQRDLNGESIPRPLQNCGREIWL